MKFLIQHTSFEHLLFYKCCLSNGWGFEAKKVIVALVTSQVLQGVKLIISTVEDNP